MCTLSMCVCVCVDVVQGGMRATYTHRLFLGVLYADTYNYCACVCVCVYLSFMEFCMHVRLYVCMHVRLYVCIAPPQCEAFGMYVCMNVFLYIHVRAHSCIYTPTLRYLHLENLHAYVCVHVMN